uniref:Uncharacterized protein n=1 Tax=Rhizophora mucronata TaxID=61149 RepID=A0A2P2PIW9_RHIMU
MGSGELDILATSDSYPLGFPSLKIYHQVKPLQSQDEPPLSTFSKAARASFC